MEFIFIDETSGRSGTDFYGVCGVCVNDKHYASLARRITACFEGAGWDTNVEFKGSWLFSSSKGDPTVTVDRRIELAAEIIALNVADKNAKLKAAFAWNREDGAESHLSLTEKVVQTLLPAIKATKADRPCIVFHDRNEKIPEKDLWRVVNDTLSNRNYRLVEDVSILRGWRSTQMGLCLCDLIAYLAAWVCSTNDAKEAQVGLFAAEQISQTDLRKAATVQRIFQNLKRIKLVGAQ